MFCTQCGTKINRVNARFCKNCGTKIVKNNFVNSRNTQDDFISRAQSKFKNYSEMTKISVVGKLDSVVENINDPNKYKKLSNSRRESITRSLTSLRQKIASDEKGNPEPTEQEAEEIVTLSEELIEELKSDKCLICLKSLNPTDNGSVSVAVCPSCGHGGHSDHIKRWVRSKETCPYCRASLKPNEVLIISLTA